MSTNPSPTPQLSSNSQCVPRVQQALTSSSIERILNTISKYERGLRLVKRFIVTFADHISSLAGGPARLVCQCQALFLPSWDSRHHRVGLQINGRIAQQHVIDKEMLLSDTVAAVADL